MTEYLLIPAGYVLGSMPWGYWLPLLFGRGDIRKLGSGNTGATNVWRSFGFKLGLAVMFLDLAKGFAPAFVGRSVGGDLVGVLAGVAATAGHWRPLFLRFARGGKIVATTGGVGLAVALFPSLAAAAVWIGVFLALRYASVASLAAAASLPLFAALLDGSWPVLAFTSGAAVAIALLHRANIVRLLNGTEHKMELRRRKAGAPATRRGPDAASL